MARALGLPIVRFFQFSDTHLGHQQYPATEGGLNARELDTYRAFHAVIDAAVAECPDFVIHAGDLFDGVRPSNRALHEAMRGFLKLSNAGIPLLLIAGNHEDPRLRETGSPLRLFSHLPHATVACAGKALHVDLVGVRVHLVPQMSSSEAIAQAIADAPLAGKDILVVHGAVQSLQAFSHTEFGELTLNPAQFTAFTHVALGHYHGAKEVAPNAWYCGAPERISMAEAKEEKGFLDVQDFDVIFRPLAGRPYRDLSPIDATDLDPDGIRHAAKSALAHIPEGAVVRLTIDNIQPEWRGSLATHQIREMVPQALYLDLRMHFQNRQRTIAGPPQIGALYDEFESYSLQVPLEGIDRATLLATVKEVLE